MAIDILSRSFTKGYVADTADGLGAVKGAPCIVESIETTENGVTLNLSWTGESGAVEREALELLNGAKGDKGDQGETGLQGPKGERGQEGKSPYDLAVENGFEGTESEWLDSLKGGSSSVNGSIAGNLIPTQNGQYNIGSESKHIKSIYVDEIYMSDDTLYVNDVALIQTNPNNDMIFSADADQSMKIKTTGIGETSIVSEHGAEIITTKESSNINVTAGDMSESGSSNVNIHASHNNEVIAKNQNTLQALYNVLIGATSVTGGLTVDSLSISGNLNVSGDVFKIEAVDTTVKDNLVIINEGEVGEGVTKGKAGFHIDRGTAAGYEFIFDESDDMFKVGEVGNLQTVASQEYVTEAIAGKVNASDMNEYLADYATKEDIEGIGGADGESISDTDLNAAIIADASWWL